MHIIIFSDVLKKQFDTGTIQRRDDYAELILALIIFVFAMHRDPNRRFEEKLTGLGFELFGRVVEPAEDDARIESTVAHVFGTSSGSAHLEHNHSPRASRPWGSSATR